MLTFIVIVFLLYLFWGYINSKNTKVSKKSNTSQDCKSSTRKNDAHQPVSKQNSTAINPTAEIANIRDQAMRAAEELKKLEFNGHKTSNRTQKERWGKEHQIADQSEYMPDAQKAALSLSKKQRDVRTRIQCNVRSRIEAKIKTRAAEQAALNGFSFVSDITDQIFLEDVGVGELLSTTAYAKKHKLKAKPQLFNYLCQHRVIERIAGKYELTAIGKSLGGQYRTGKNGNKWIVWPNNALDDYVTQLQEQSISDLPFAYLCHMTHIDNLAGILQHGLQPHTNKHKIKDISNSDVNIRRRKIETVNSKIIHSYVPFYFNARNAMLFQVQKQYGDNVVILGYDKSLTCQAGSVFSDGNAASGVTKFFDELSTLQELAWAEVFSKNWATCGNVNSDLKRKMMSEALIPGTVPASRLRVIYCASLSTKSHIISNYSLPHVEVIVEPRIFF